MSQPDLLNGADAANTLQLLRQHAPLVHCMTNDVVQSFTANVLLASGASPAMIIDALEAAQFSAIASGLLVNIGTLTLSRSAAMRAAVESARRNNKPWVLDPVAVGGLTLRTGFALELLDLHPAAIRGNASEIIALMDKAGGGRGVDTTQRSEDALPAARDLARQTGGIVIVSGAVDYATDGERIIAIPGGDPLMTRVVGTGCALSALVAAAMTLPGDRLKHGAAACGLFARAGEQAVAHSQGPGSFLPAFLDALWGLAPEALV